MRGKPFAPSLAESYDVAPDFKSATFKLRPHIKFHDGSPITPDDVTFTYMQYRGANAKILHDKLDRIDAPDDRTVKFFFKEPCTRPPAQGRSGPGSHQPGGQP